MHSGAPSARARRRRRPAAAGREQKLWTQRQRALTRTASCLPARRRARLPGCQAWPGFLRRPEASEHHRYTARDGPLNPAWRKLPDEMYS